MYKLLFVNGQKTQKKKLSGHPRGGSSKKKQNAFSNKNIIVNNKYNMLYSENERKYELKLSKMSMTQKQRREKHIKELLIS